MANSGPAFIPELILDETCALGEGPLWHAQEKLLYWIDIPVGTILSFSSLTGERKLYPTGSPIGGFTIQADGSLLLFGAGGRVICWHKGETSVVVDGLPGEEATRFNDVIADEAGGVLCGTLSSKNHAGTLYYLDPSGQIRKILDNVLCSNGLAFTPDRRYFYYTDSDRGEIYRFTYAPGGQLSDRQIFARIPAEEGVPDGMTVDEQGYVWSARWNGNCLVRYDPDGREVLRIGFPARKVTCPTFAGPDYSDLYITTAGGNNRPVEGSGAGALFRLQLGIRGLPEFCSRVERIESKR